MSAAETLAPWVGADRALGALDAAVDPLPRRPSRHLPGQPGRHHTRFAGDRIHQPQTIVELQVMVRAVVGTGAAASR